MAPEPKGIPKPDRSVGNEQHVLCLAQAAGNGFAIELAHELFDAQASRGITAQAHYERNQRGAFWQCPRLTGVVLRASD